MLYGNDIYKLYLELSNEIEKVKAVYFDLCDYSGGCNELSAFKRLGGFEDFKIRGQFDFPIMSTPNECLIINPNRFRIKVTDPKILRRLIFDLDEFVYGQFETTYYIENIAVIK